MRYSYLEKPLRIYGVPFFERDRILRRLPPEVSACVNNREGVAMWHLDRRCPGARLRFRTDAKEITLGLTFETLSPDAGMSIYSCQAAYVYFGTGPNAMYQGHFFPANYQTKTIQRTFHNENGMTDVTLFLPRNEVISDVWAEVETGARVKEATPYRVERPILFYGSSITEGGCCSKTSNSYNALVCRWLDADFYNMGFSGSAQGESAVCDYLSQLEDVGIFVLDYDHNAPSEAHLRQTHEAFYQRYRAARPDTPIVLMSRPVFYVGEDDIARREVILETYRHGKEAGDENLYFVDGLHFFDEVDAQCCTNDLIHPNDLGMYYMAKALYPVLDGILKHETNK